MAKTRRSPDGVFATPGAVGQHDGKLPIYICNGCELEVVWATSKRTGRKYLANISRGRTGARFYIGSNIHRCAGRLDEDDRSYEAWTDFVRDFSVEELDEWARRKRLAKEAYLEAWNAREHTGTNRSAYYDDDLYRVTLPAGGDARELERVLRAGPYRNVGRDMAAYGKFGGYSSLGRVTDNGDGTATVANTYHIGD